MGQLLDADHVVALFQKLPRESTVLQVQHHRWAL